MANAAKFRTPVELIDSDDEETGSDNTALSELANIAATKLFGFSSLEKLKQVLLQSDIGFLQELTAVLEASAPDLMDSESTAGPHTKNIHLSEKIKDELFSAASSSFAAVSEQERTEASDSQRWKEFQAAAEFLNEAEESHSLFVASQVHRNLNDDLSAPSSVEDAILKCRSFLAKVFINSSYY